MLRTQRNQLVLTAIAAAVLCGCSARTNASRPSEATPAAIPTTQTQQPPTGTTPGRRQYDGDDTNSQEDRYATLRIGRDIVQSCPKLLAVRFPVGEEGDAWLFMLRSLADCMTHGKLRSRHIVVEGQHEPQEVVAFVLQKLGVAPERVERADAPVAKQHLDCLINLVPGGIQALHEVRATPGGGAQPLSISVDTQRVVAMAMGEDLDW